MNVSAPFIARPVATSLLAAAILLAGALGYRYLPISSLPEVDFPTIEVTTRLPGADADTITALVTAPLERALGEVQSLEAMTSTGSYGWSRITLRFRLDRDIDAAAQDVQSALSAASALLPGDLPYEPTYAKVNPADTPVVTLALTSDTLPIDRLSDLADTFLAQQMSQVAGVGRVTVQGDVRPAVRIQADPARLAAYGLGLEAIRAAIAGANISGPKGSLDGAQKAVTIGVNDQLTDARAYGEVVIAEVDGRPVFLRDVARVTAGVENAKTEARVDGRPAVVIDVRRQPGANIVATVDALKARLPGLEEVLPAGARLRIVADRTATIRASVGEVRFSLVLSVALVVLVVLLFLRTLSATLVAGVTLPLSLIGGFAVMWLAGFGLDSLSLMALTIATGFVVDDAIVMIENVTRHIERGATPMKAARDGAAEIGFTIVSLTASLIAVFIPLLFMTGIVGRLFRDFALTLTITVVVSAAVSLTLTPMMCARLLRPAGERRRNALARLSDGLLDGLFRFYRMTLDRALRMRGVVLAVAAATLAATAALYVVIPKGFLPDQDTGFLTATTEAAPDASFGRMRRLQGEVEAIVRGDPDVAGVVSLVGASSTNPAPNTGQMAISLKPVGERDAGPAAIIARLRQRLDALPDVTVYLQPVQDLRIATGASRTRYQYVLTDTDAAELALWSERLRDALEREPVLRGVASDLQDGGPRLRIEVDRVAAGRLGVSMRAVDDTLYDAFGQRQISTIYGQSNQYRVILEVDPRYQTDPAALGVLRVPGADGALVPLDAFARAERTTAPLTVGHVDQFPAVTLSFDLPPGASLDQAVAAIAAAEGRIGLPEGVRGAFVGEALEFNAALENQPWLILAAVVVIYIVLGVLYESLIHPLTILSTLPSAGVGALLALMLFGMELSLVGLIGIILLMGIVKKNAIIMIDFALDAERRRGLAPEDAIREACLLRFRPIMMTTLAALLGALPLALAHGAGAELRVPLGVAIIGGLLLSQVLTLYTTPVIYLAMEGLRRRLSRRLGVDPDRPPAPGAAGLPARGRAEPVG